MDSLVKQLILSLLKDEDIKNAIREILIDTKDEAKEDVIASSLIQEEEEINTITQPVVEQIIAKQPEKEVAVTPVTEESNIITYMHIEKKDKIIGKYEGVKFIWYYLSDNSDTVVMQGITDENKIAECYQALQNKLIEDGFDFKKITPVIKEEVAPVEKFVMPIPKTTPVHNMFGDDDDEMIIVPRKPAVAPTHNMFADEVEVNEEVILPPKSKDTRIKNRSGQRLKLIYEGARLTVYFRNDGCIKGTYLDKEYIWDPLGYKTPGYIPDANRTCVYDPEMYPSCEMINKVFRDIGYASAKDYVSNFNALKDEDNAFLDKLLNS